MESFCSFVDKNPSTPFLIDNLRNLLRRKNFVELHETEDWEEIPEKGFFLRDNKAIIAYKGYKPGIEKEHAFILSAPTNNPSAWIKSNNSFEENGFKKESIFYNRTSNENANLPLRVSGTVYIKKDGKIWTRLYDSVDPIVSITSGYERAATVNYAHKKGLKEAVADKLDVNADDIIDWELTISQAEQCVELGIKKDFICGPSIKTLSLVYAAYEAFINSSNEGNGLQVLFIANHPQSIASRYSLFSNILPNLFEKIVPNKADRSSFIARSYNVDLSNLQQIFTDVDKPNISLGKGFLLYSPIHSKTSILPVLLCAKKLDIKFQQVNKINLKEIEYVSGIPTACVSLPCENNQYLVNTIAAKDLDNLISILKELSNNLAAYYQP